MADNTPVRLSDRRFLEGHNLTLNDNKTYTVDVYGRYFMVRDCNEAIEMRVNGSHWFEIQQGEGWDLGDDDRFTKLQFRRPSGQTETIELSFRTSDCFMFDARLNIVRGRSAPIMQAPSVWTPHSQTIAAGATVDLTAVHPTKPKYLRKATIVTNMDPAVDVEILDAADAILDSVFFRSTKLYEVAEGIKIKNNTGAPVVIRAAQAWYIIDI